MAFAFVAILAATAPTVGAGEDGFRYTGASTVVVKDSETPSVDEGVLVCPRTGGGGVGGACVPFGGSHLEVIDDMFGWDVAYQVCIDNDGDGACAPTSDSEPCSDDLFFSHADDGTFFNPIGPLPPGFKPGCGAGAFDGYLVFLCEGAHMTGAQGPHLHPATAGLVRRLPDGPPALGGDFCLGQPKVKSYILV